MNDLETTAYGALFLPEGEIQVLHEGRARRGNAAVIAALVLGLGAGTVAASLSWTATPDFMSEVPQPHSTPSSSSREGTLSAIGTFDVSYVFVASDDANVVHRIPKAGGAVMALDAGWGFVTALALDANDVWWIGRAPAGPAWLTRAAKAGDCAKALPLLERAVAKDRRDADALNLLAYCQRKTGKLDSAFENYRRALELRPEFPAAREYLGEAHVQAALREVEILRGYGEPARAELEALVKALRDAADAAEEGEAPADRGGW